VTEPTQPEPQRREVARKDFYYGCLGLLLALPFGILFLFLTASFGQTAGPIAAVAVVVGMFLWRRSTPKPFLGAAAIGAVIAFVVYGACMTIIFTSK
jgi:hypothetical protein